MIERFQQILNLLLSFMFSKRKPVRVKRNGNMFSIEVERTIMLAPGRRRWRMYHHGVDARLDAVARRYGLHDLRPANEGEWVIDVGAYMGEWALHVLRKGFNVLAIEPDPMAARCLAKNLLRHAPPGRKWLIDTRVSLDRQRSVTFYSEPTNADGSIFPSLKHSTKPISLDAETLDSIVVERIGGGGQCVR